jgi:hypothetical protein
MGLSGMILSKETYILHVVCAAIAMGVCYVSNYFNELDDSRPASQTWTYVDLAVVVGTSVTLIVAFYSGFFFHWNGVKGLFEAYKPWFRTGSEGHGHEKPWYYWLRLIVRYEWPVLAGLVICLLNLKTRIPVIRWLAIWTLISAAVGQAILWVLVHFQLVGFNTNNELFWLPAGLAGAILLGLGSISISQMPLRYLAIYGLGTLMAYSIVKYKTPWCIISFVWPYFFIFGAAASIAPLIYRRAIYLVSIVLLTGSLGYCVWLNYFRCTTDTEPYVYVQSYNDVFRFTDPILQLAHSDPRAYQLVGHIIRASPYPLPWMLDDFGRVGYYEKDSLPDKVDGDFLLVQEDKIATVEAKLHDSYYTMPIKIRPYQDLSKAYFNAKIFKSYFPGQWPNFTGPAPTPPPSPSPSPTPSPPK